MPPSKSKCSTCTTDLFGGSLWAPFVKIKRKTASPYVVRTCGLFLCNRGDRTAIELFVAGVRGLAATICAMLSQDATGQEQAQVVAG